MKTSVGTLALLGAALTAGLALAQTPPQPRGDRARAEPDGAAGETRAQLNSSGATVAAEAMPSRTSPGSLPGCGPGLATSDSSNRDHIDQDATGDIYKRGCAATTPTNGIGGTGGGRYTFVPTTRARIINNSETDTAEVDGAAARPGTGTRPNEAAAETRATVNATGEPLDILAWSWGRIDRINTVEACTARRGQVVMHEGVQQCRIPATPSARR